MSANGPDASDESHLFVVIRLIVPNDLLIGSNDESGTRRIGPNTPRDRYLPAFDRLPQGYAGRQQDLTTIGHRVRVITPVPYAVSLPQ